MVTDGKIIMICGKIGVGKTTYTNTLIMRHNAVNLSQDELMITLFGAEFYYKNPQKHESFVERANEYTKKKAAELARAGAIIILDNGFWSKSERDEYKQFYASKGVACELHYVKTPEEQRIANIKRRNVDIENGASSGNEFFMEESAFDHVFEEPSAAEADVIVNFGEF